MYKKQTKSDVKITYRLKSDKFVIVNVKSDFLSQLLIRGFVQILIVLSTIYTGIPVYNVQIERRLERNLGHRGILMKWIYYLLAKRSNSR